MKSYSWPLFLTEIKETVLSNNSITYQRIIFPSWIQQQLKKSDEEIVYIRVEEQNVHVLKSITLSQWHLIRGKSYKNYYFYWRTTSKEFFILLFWIFFNLKTNVWQYLLKQMIKTQQLWKMNGGVIFNETLRKVGLADKWLFSFGKASQI